VGALFLLTGRASAQALSIEGHLPARLPDATRWHCAQAARCHPAPDLYEGIPTINILSKDPDGKIISRSLGLGTLLDQLAAAVIIEASCPTLA
jgi:hypothetical protein